ncbi:MAG: cupin domain-containing protein [Patescibacteria group bacterium]
MDITEYKKLANIIRDTEIYKVFDLASLKHLTVSLTELYPEKSTSGHSHENSDEVYVFIDGIGTMEIGDKTFQVKAGDLILVPSGNFHKVHNKGEKNLSFWAIFEKYEGRGI